MLVILTAVQALQCAGAMFFHEPSSVIIQGVDDANNSDFGFAMAYMKESQTLVVGAPRADFIGKVFNCEMEDVMEKRNIECGEQIIDYDPSDYDKKKFPEQHFLMGSTISAAKDYFFTCAPLWTTTVDVIEKNQKRIPTTDTYGTCFIQNKRTERYKGLLEYYINYNGKRENFTLNRPALLIKRISSGTGWSTLIDYDNDLLLIAKTSGDGDFSYAPSSVPLQDVRSLLDQSKYNKYFKKFFNIGFGITAGKFFRNQTMYAFSLLHENMEGSIHFLEYYKDSYPRFKQRGLLSILALNLRESYRGHFVKLESKAVGSMFGTTMSAADLNMDGLDELLVGAPTQAGYECYECGALHIYIGGNMSTLNQDKRLRSIFGTSEFGRFGTAITSKDIDGDGKSELVISAPYENEGSGVIYILSGYEVYHNLMKTQEYKAIQVSELKLTQILQKTTSKGLGFSLQFINDVDVNGCDELAAGSPGASKVLLFKCVKKINVTLTSQLLGEQLVREQDTSFIIQVCARVEHPILPADFVGNITLENNITGETATVQRPNIVIDISCFGCVNDTIVYCENVTVELADKEPGYYVFKSKAQLQNKYLTELNMTDFNNTWVEASAYSTMDTSLEVFRHCKGDDCVPKLSVNVTWSGGKRYVLGSSTNETVRIKVHNEGNASYSACVWVHVIGAVLSQASCDKYREGFKCKNLPIPLKRDTDAYIDLMLNMPKPTSDDENLTVEVYLYENCNKETDNSSQILTIPFELTSEGIFNINDTHKLNVTDRQILENATVYDHQEYPIKNHGNITWKRAEFTAVMEKKPYINSFIISARDLGECKADILPNSSFIIYHCTLDLQPNKTHIIIGTTEILAGRLHEFGNGAELNISSRSQLHLSFQMPAIFAKSVTTIKIIKEITLARNKWLISVIAAIVALILLIILTIILYKCGFFRRKQKQNLLVMQESVRRKSVRRHTHVSAMDEPAEGLQIDVVEDSPFDEARPVTSSDNVGLVDDDDM